MARLGSRLAYREAQEELALLWGLRVSTTAIRTATIGYGQLAVEQHDAEVDRLEREAPAATEQPEQLVMSADGAFVQLTNGDWREVKTVAFGEFSTKWNSQQRRLQVETEKLSYFSRLAPAEVFGRQTLVEWQRRGGENAKRMVAVNDGAAWIQSFIDYHCPQATRVIDFAHAQGYVARIGRAIYEADSPAFKQWFATMSRQLRRKPPQRTLDELRFLCQQQSDHPERQELEQALHYLESRREMIDYAHFRRQQIPIGSGIAESGHKVVMQRRMKQAGMRWAEANVNPMLALRTLLCNQRWQAKWPLLYQAQRQKEQQQRRQKARRPVTEPLTLASVAVDWEKAPAMAALDTKQTKPNLWREGRWPARYW
jgi:hypothetical protein